MNNLLDKLSEEMSFDVLAQNIVSGLVQSEGITLDLTEFVDGHFDIAGRGKYVDIPNQYFGCDIRIFVGEKDGSKYLIGIPPRPRADTQAFLLTQPITHIEKFKEGGYRINTRMNGLVFYQYKKNDETK